MDIIVGDVYSTLAKPKKNPKALGIIREICRARPKGYMFMYKYKIGMWDGYISVMGAFNKFPTGLLNIVEMALKVRGYEYNVVHTKPKMKYIEPQPDMLHGVTLRDYQLEAVSVLLKNKRGVAKMATNSGKTEVMATIIKSLMCKTMVLVHRKELMYQTAERFEIRTGEACGIVGDGNCAPKRVTVAMVQTMSRNIKDTDILNCVRGNKLLMVDECHHLSSDQMMDVIKIIKGNYRFGFSGTPLKHDTLADLKLLGMTGPVLFEITNDFLIKEGYSAKPIVVIHTVEELDVGKWEMKYQDAYKELIVNNVVRNKIIADVANRSNGTTLILVNRISHGKTLCNMIPGSVFVNGSDTIEFRQSIIESMRKEPGVYIASPIFDEGIDVPAVNMVVIACGDKSYVKLLQRIGRGMRSKSGKNELIIHDFMDDTNMYLLDHSSERIDTYVQEGFTTNLV